MGTTRAEILIPTCRSQLPMQAPSGMTMSGIDRGLPVNDLLTAFFAHIGEIGGYQAHPDFLVDNVCSTHGSSNALHSVLLAFASSNNVIRPTIGNEIRTSLDVDKDGLHVTPDYGRLSPRQLDFYVTLRASYRAKLSRTTASMRLDCDCRGRVG